MAATLNDLRDELLATLPQDAVKLDLGCGQSPLEGFKGVDLFADGPNIARVDLYTYPWPFPDESVDFFRASHFLEHVPDWDAHFTEVYRCLKTGGHYEIIAPYFWSDRWHGDPDHKQPIIQRRFFYLYHKWRKANKIEHYGAKVNLVMLEWFELLHPDFLEQGYSADAIRSMKVHQINVLDDVATVLRKEPMEKEGA